MAKTDIDQNDGVSVPEGREWRNASGALHRLDGPAFEGDDGSCFWYADGKLHRLDGPAVESLEYGDDHIEYWLDGRQLSKRDFDHLTQPEILSLLREGERFAAAADRMKVNPYYLGYAIDTGAETPKQAFDRDHGNYGYIQWNRQRWREQAAIVQAGEATSITPTELMASRIHHGIIARHLGPKLDAYLEKETARGFRFKDLFGAKPESLTHDKARLIVRDASFGGGYENLMTTTETDWTRRVFMHEDSPFDCFAAVIRGLAVSDQLYNNCPHGLPPDWTKFERLEIGGCIDDPDEPGHTIGGMSDDEAQFWTIYGRCPDGDAEAITDCATLPDAVMVAHRLAARSRLSCSSSGFDIIEPYDSAPESIEEAKVWMEERARIDSKSEPGPSL